MASITISNKYGQHATTSGSESVLQHSTDLHVFFSLVICHLALVDDYLALHREVTFRFSQAPDILRRREFDCSRSSPHQLGFRRTPGKGPWQEAWPCFS